MGSLPLIMAIAERKSLESDASSQRMRNLSQKLKLPTNIAEFGAEIFKEAPLVRRLISKQAHNRIQESKVLITAVRPS